MIAWYVAFGLCVLAATVALVAGYIFGESSHYSDDERLNTMLRRLDAVNSERERVCREVFARRDGPAVVVTPPEWAIQLGRGETEKEQSNG